MSQRTSSDTDRQASRLEYTVRSLEEQVNTNAPLIHISLWREQCSAPHSSDSPPVAANQRKESYGSWRFEACWHPQAHLCWEDAENPAKFESDTVTAGRGVEPPGEKLTAYRGTARPCMRAELVLSTLMLATGGYAVVFAQSHFPTGPDGN